MANKFTSLTKLPEDEMIALIDRYINEEQIFQCDSINHNTQFTIRWADNSKSQSYYSYITIVSIKIYPTPWNMRINSLWNMRMVDFARVVLGVG